MTTVLDKIKVVCKKLQDVYDSSILKKEDRDIQLVFNSIVSNKIETFKDANPNKTLISLIYNLYNNKKPIVDYLSGPCSISLQTIGTKRIYIFGEYHGYQNNCFKNKNINNYRHMTIYNYLHYLFSTTDVFIDFYIEAHLPSILRSENPLNLYIQGYMRDITNELYPCLEPKYRADCPYNTIRAHSVDSRYEQGVSQSRLGCLKIDILNVLDKRKLKLSKSSYKEYLKLRHTETYLKRIIEDDISWNVKEIKRSTMKKEIHVLIDKYSSLYASKINKIFINGRFPEIPPRSQKKYHEFLFNLSDVLTVIESLVMDIYTIARIFKEFDIKTQSNQPKDPNNIIIYCGNSHARNLRNILEDLGSKLVNYETQCSDRYEERCLDMRKFQQPLFD